MISSGDALDHEISCLETSLAVTAADSRGRPTALTSLAIMLLRRYDAYGLAGDLDRVVTLLGAVLEDRPDNSIRLKNLGSALRASRIGSVGGMNRCSCRLSERSLWARKRALAMNAKVHGAKATGNAG
jgi:hypothetical protein